MVCADNYQKQNQIYMSILQGIVRDDYITAFQKRTAANSAAAASRKKTPKQVLVQVITDTGKKFFSNDCDWSTAYRYQKAYMRKKLFIGDMCPDIFCDRLSKLNRMLKYFPPREDFKPAPQVLDDDKLCNILDSAKKPE